MDVSHSKKKKRKVGKLMCGPCGLKEKGKKRI